LDLEVTEPWRSGDAFADSLVAVTPGYLTGAVGKPGRVLVAPKTGQELSPRIAGDEVFDALVATVGLAGLDSLPDAVRISADGLLRVRGLVFVVRETGILVLRARDAQGRENGFEKRIEQYVGGVGDLPPEWNGPGPWNEPVDAALAAWAASPYAREHGGGLYFFAFDLPEDTVSVDIGMTDDRVPWLSHWGVVAFEAVTAAEVRRHDYDETHRQTTVDVIDGALGIDPSSRALLHPGATYTVKVDYSVLATDADEKGNPIAVADPLPEDHSKSFRFRTDDAAPVDLAPFVLATNPADGEDAVFFEDSIRIVFAGGATRRLYKEYGIDLFARVRAASGRHPPSPTDLAPGLVLLANTSKPSIDIAAEVFTPFEGALRDAVKDQDCIPSDQLVGEPHDMVVIPMALEPMTGYVLDVEGRDSQGQLQIGGGRDPALRRSFTTSRYGSVADFAAAIKAAGVRATDVRDTTLGDRHIADPAPFASLGGGTSPEVTVSDIAFETALRNVGWAEFARPAAPRVTVLWTSAGGTAPQPFGIFIETPEAAWRSRGVPEEVADAAGSKAWTLVPRPWLAMTSASPAVARFIHTTGGMRTLVLLNDGARSETVEVALERIFRRLFEGTDNAPAPSLALQVSLDRAPWEDG
jgi:hypothetical protein